MLLIIVQLGMQFPSNLNLFLYIFLDFLISIRTTYDTFLLHIQALDIQYTRI